MTDDSSPEETVESVSAVVGEQSFVADVTAPECSELSTGGKSARPATTWRDVVRACGFVAALGWMLISPGYFHIGHNKLGWKAAWWSKGWSMMHYAGKGICDVRVYELRDGEKTRVNRYRRLGYRRARLAPLEGVRRVYLRHLNKHLKQLCAATDRKVDLRAEVRCAGDEGWEDTRFRGDVNLCTSQRWPMKRTKPRKPAKTKAEPQPKQGGEKHTSLWRGGLRRSTAQHTGGAITWVSPTIAGHARSPRGII